jgi:hypothetical protein
MIEDVRPAKVPRHREDAMSEMMHQVIETAAMHGRLQQEAAEANLRYALASTSCCNTDPR